MNLVSRKRRRRIVGRSLYSGGKGELGTRMLKAVDVLERMVARVRRTAPGSIGQVHCQRAERES